MSAAATRSGRRTASRRTHEKPRLVASAIPVARMHETRGVRYDVRSRMDGDVRILIWRHCEPSGVWPREMRVERIRVL
jgi:hypothetical protein